METGHTALPVSLTPTVPPSWSDPAEQSTESSGSSILIPIQYEVYSNYTNRPTAQDTMTLPSTLPPLQFRNCIVEAMGLEPDTAKLACNIFGVAKAQPRCVFNTEEQVKEAIRKAEGFVRRGRKIPKGLNVLNLDPVAKSENCESPESTPSSSKFKVPKSKVPGKLSKHESILLQKAMRVKESIVKLRARLRCQLCHGEFCFVDPRTSRHIRCSIEMITLWARLLVETPQIVTLNQPPNHRWFDASHGTPLASVAGNSGGPIAATDSNILGSGPTNAIFVSDDSPPPVKRERESSLDIIEISSDSDSNVDFEDLDSLPDPSNNLGNHVTIPESNSPLVQLLFDLQSAFAPLDFVSFHPRLEEFGIQSVRELATQTIYWLSESIGMGRGQALVTLGAAMLVAGDDGAPVDTKGKGKARD